MEILSENGLLGSNPSKIPLERNIKLDNKFHHHRKLIGRLIYLDITRPDISFAVQNISQFMSESRPVQTV